MVSISKISSVSTFLLSWEELEGLEGEDREKEKRDKKGKGEGRGIGVVSEIRNLEEFKGN